MTVIEKANWILDALASDPFVAARTILWDGYNTRGVPGAFFPSGVIDHHTADMANIGHDPINCIRSNIADRPERRGPTSQLHGTFTPPGVKWNGNNADPRIVVLSLLRANHAGAGEYPWGAPSGNASSIGIEWCGPPDGMWPDIVIELRERVVACLIQNRGWPVSQVTTHYEYARPIGRKIDPSGPTYFAPNLKRLDPWPASVWRQRVEARRQTLVQGDDMKPLDSPERAYDSRNVKQFQDDVTPALKAANKGVPLSPLQPNQYREIVVGMCTEAEIVMTAVGHGGHGHVLVSPAGKDTPVGICNFSPSNPAVTSTIGVKTPNGKVRVRCGPAPCDIVVNVTQRTP